MKFEWIITLQQSARTRGIVTVQHIASAIARRHVVGALLLALLAVSCAGTEARATDAALAPRFRDLPAERPLVVGIVVVDGVYGTELVAPWDVFHHTVFHAQPGMRVITIAPTLATVTSFEGLRLLPDHGFADAPPVDVLVVPSALHSMDSDLADAALIGYVQRAAAGARVVLSLCDGAFVLAQAGVLDGRECTTFPTDVGAMRTAFPALTIHEGVSFVHDGPVITSAGGAKSYDAALYLCQLLYGESAARGVAAGITIDWDLSGIPCLIVP